MANYLCFDAPPASCKPVQHTIQATIAGYHFFMAEFALPAFVTQLAYSMPLPKLWKGPGFC